MKFSIKYFFSKCDQIRRKLRIWSYLLNKSLIENFIFCAAPIKHVRWSSFVRIIIIIVNLLSISNDPPAEKTTFKKPSLIGVN